MFRRLIIVTTEFNKATICMNGHCISKDSIISDTFCEQCGEKGISHCPNCGAEIHGVEQGEYSFAINYVPPKYCWKCGAPYPWTKK